MLETVIYGVREMKDFLEHYKVKLTVRGPVFVGNGHEFSKKEYLFLPGQRVGIVDIQKMYQLMGRKGRIRQFEDFMLSSYADLGRWLDNERLKQDVERQCIAYTLDRGDTVLERGTRTQIMACMKEAGGRPYIPGSTLKGMLRSILAADYLLKNSRLRDNMQREIERELPMTRNRKSCLARTVKGLEAKIFCRLNREHTRPNDAVNDILSGLVVSDSEPLDIKALVLAQKIERRVDGTEKTLNLLRESLRPGTEIKFTLTIDHSLCSLTKADILQAIECFDENYSDNFLAAYSGVDRLRPPQVYVGGGAGFVSKTLLYPLMGKKDGIETAVQIFDKTRVPREHKHREDKRLGVSPHIIKCTHYKGQTLQMGLCDVVID